MKNVTLLPKEQIVEREILRMKIARAKEKLIDKTEPSTVHKPAQPVAGPDRRRFLHMFGIGALLTAVGGQTYAMLRALVPDLLYEEPLRFKLGTPADFPEGATYLDDRRLFVFREQSTFYAISSTCTHLGCTVKMTKLAQSDTATTASGHIQQPWEFDCPCHGSKFDANGSNYAGPAPRPLNWVKLEVAPEDGQLVVNMSEKVKQNFRLTV
jgi:nitrite reductase/ring-hydroxylating ferredoxin subunit